MIAIEALKQPGLLLSATKEFIASFPDGSREERNMIQLKWKSKNIYHDIIYCQTTNNYFTRFNSTKYAFPQL